MTMYHTKNLTLGQESVLWRVCEDAISIEEAIEPSENYTPHYDSYTIVGAQLWFNSKNRRRLLTHINHVIEECENISATTDLAKAEELYDAVCDCICVEVQL